MLAGIALALRATLAHAQIAHAPPDQGSAHASPLTPEAEIFVVHEPDASRGIDLTRVSFSIVGTVSSRLSFRLTPDLVREVDEAGVGPRADAVHLRQAYVELSLESLTRRWTRSWLRAGMQPTPIIEFVEGVYRYRFQGPTFVERAGALPSADRGVSAHANLPHGFGDVQVGVFDGRGYLASALDRQRGAQVRGTLRPFPARLVSRGLRITAGLDSVRIHADPSRPVATLSVTFEHPHINIGGDYVRRDPAFAPAMPDEARAGGWSVWATPVAHAKGAGFEGLLRFDVEHPARDATTTRTRAVVGVAYWLRRETDNMGAAILVDVERVDGQTDDRRVAVHTRLTF